LTTVWAVGAATTVVVEGGGGGVPSMVVVVGGIVVGATGGGAMLVGIDWATPGAESFGAVGAENSGRIAAALRISTWMMLEDTPRSFR
jgi:hypothetical protein